MIKIGNTILYFKEQYYNIFMDILNVLFTSFMISIFVYLAVLTVQEIVENNDKKKKDIIIFIAIFVIVSICWSIRYYGTKDYDKKLKKEIISYFKYLDLDDFNYKNKNKICEDILEIIDKEDVDIEEME